MKKFFSLVLALVAATTLTFAATDQTVDCGTTVTIKATAEPGYTFAGWKMNNGNNIVSTEAEYEVTVSADVTYTATFTANTNTAYTVKHYKQNVDGTYPNAAADTDNETGTTGEQTAATAKSYTGFSAPQTITQQAIAGDGSTVITLQYTRNSYAFAWDADGGTLSGGTSAGNIKYEASITAPTAEKTGYSLSGWKDLDGNTVTLPTTMPAKSLTLVAQWTAAEVSYTINHYQEKLDGTYPSNPTETVTGYGYTGDNTNAQSKGYTGFTVQTITQKTIAADGSTVVDVYYKRNTFTVKFFNAEGDQTPLQTIENVKYGATVSYSGNTTPSKAEDTDYYYTFNGWSPSISDAITGNTEFVAQFSAVAKVYYDITASVTPTGRGTVTITGLAANDKALNGTEITLTAESDDNCYEFEKWTLGGQTVGTSSELKITASADAEYVAVFKKKTFKITIQSEDDTKGTVSFKQ